MRNIVSLIIGAFALIFVIIAFLPFLGWANWFFIPVAIVGLAIGATSPSKAGRNLNIVVIIIGVIRLMLGGGFF